MYLHKCLKLFSACVAILRWVPQPAIFVSQINSAALRVMDVRNHGRCHGDATLQYSFAARLPMLAAASKLGKTTGGRGRKRRQEDRLE